MNHSDHVRLISAGIPTPGGHWADLGCGDGAFTLALADRLGPGAQITAVDRDQGALQGVAQSMARQFPATRLATIRADFTQPLSLRDLDGVVMANSLHFVRDKLPALRLILQTLRPGGTLILVEYGADHGNPWVPHPLSFATWSTLASSAGLTNTRHLAAVPSRFLNTIYAAASEVAQARR